MTGWLLDTNVLSELRRPRLDRHVVGFVGEKPLDQLYVSTVTLAEIRSGIELVTDAKTRTDFTDWLGMRARPMFERRVLPVTEDVMVSWRLLVENGHKQGIRFPSPT